MGRVTQRGSFMDRFIQRENLKHLRALLAQTTEDAECRQIMKLIEEEEAKTFDKNRSPQSGGGRGFNCSLVVVGDLTRRGRWG